ncbi:unnamed protein product [Parnassius apollo]|uniref:(apollo) hypothetical protein n=1 Tax=Parnassius apollo TaxID=110799 RepID=A0A8S3WVX0_PARAO|nr:unnamed protein product [Parnassius apollo]
MGHSACAARRSSMYMAGACSACRSARNAAPHTRSAVPASLAPHVHLLVAYVPQLDGAQCVRGEALQHVHGGRVQRVPLGPQRRASHTQRRARQPRAAHHLLVAYVPQLDGAQCVRGEALQHVHGGRVQRVPLGPQRRASHTQRRARKPRAANHLLVAYVPQLYGAQCVRGEALQHVHGGHVQRVPLGRQRRASHTQRRARQPRAAHHLLVAYVPKLYGAQCVRGEALQHLHGGRVQHVPLGPQRRAAHTQRRARQPRAAHHLLVAYVPQLDGAQCVRGEALQHVHGGRVQRVPLGPQRRTAHTQRRARQPRAAHHLLVALAAPETTYTPRLLYSIHEQTITPCFTLITLVIFLIFDRI